MSEAGLDAVVLHVARGGGRTAKTGRNGAPSDARFSPLMESTLFSKPSSMSSGLITSILIHDNFCGFSRGAELAFDRPGCRVFRGPQMWQAPAAFVYSPLLERQSPPRRSPACGFRRGLPVAIQFCVPAI